MRNSIRLAGLALVAVSCAVGCSGTDPGEPQGQSSQALGAPFGTAHVCTAAKPGEARCHAHVVLGKDGSPAASTTYTGAGYAPADLQAAYALPSSTNGAGFTVALVDAYGYPNAESDLAVYRAQFGLPPCTTANGCFKKVNQNGVAGSYPRASSGWSQEAALDLDMVSAICPRCNIILVEANSSSMTDLGAGVNAAIGLGAKAVSNSYGGGESSSDLSYDTTYFNHPGIAITASSGDNGYGVEYPAASQYVTAVGGTHLTKDSTQARGWSETAWSGAGSGCSKYDPKPSWQKDTGCAMRTVADVSAVADPNTGVAVYETSGGRGGWMVFGGTSVASPIVAAVYALSSTAVVSGSNPYAATVNLNDVTSGSNGTCGGSYLCTAGVGYDGPTGLGTPSGASAF